MNKTTPPMSCPPALFRWAIPRIISMGVAHRSGILPFQGGTTHHTLRALKELYKHFARNRIVSTFGIETPEFESAFDFILTTNN